MMMLNYIRIFAKRCHAVCRRLVAGEAGALAVTVALCMPIFIAAAGMAVDLSQAYNVRNRLANALDKAALAAGSTSGTEAQIRARAEAFVHANYRDNTLGDVTNIHVTLGDNTVDISATSRVGTSFMSIFGTDYLEVNADTSVRREMAGVEVVLVLDVTGSMAGNNLATLKTASLNFIDIMFKRISDVNYLRIGIVPFSQTVNVGPYGLGKDLKGNNYGTAFVSKPSSDDYTSPASNIAYGTSTNSWKGCITERSSPKDMTDDASPNWGMYRYPKICSKTKNGVCQSYSNNNPNTSCPASMVIPLTNDRDKLEDSIDGLTAAGGTYIPVGTVWGWRLISPSSPFNEGTAYNDPDWTKTVIVMTDGNNEPSSEYSAYGKNSSLTATQLNNKFASLCTSMKAKGIRLYTVTFQSGITNSTRTIFRECATDETKYFNAPNNADLTTAFSQIANQLSELHIVK